MTEIITNNPLGFWNVLAEMAPYLLFGFFVAGLLSVWISPTMVERHLGGRGFFPVLKASAFGVPLPLCSCGVIPVSASLRRHGAGKGATTAFLVSTPQTGVDSILVTYSLLGGVFAIFRPIIALITGIVSGLLVSGFEKKPPKTAESSESSCSDACCTPTRDGKFKRAVRYGFDALPRDIGPALLVGVVIAALISAAIPKNYFADLVQPGIGQILILMLAGIPVYVCATASVPVAFALIGAGVSPGAAFAFLMTGPATNAATIATVAKVMGKRTAIIYLLSMAAGAILGGLALDQMISITDVTGEQMTHWMLPTWFKYACAVILLIILGRTLFVGRITHDPNVPEEEEQPFCILNIDGMTCSHCAESIRRALSEVPGVDRAEVDLESKKARVFGNGKDSDALRRIIEELGYNVTEAEVIEPEKQKEML